MKTTNQYLKRCFAIESGTQKFFVKYAGTCKAEHEAHHSRFIVRERTALKLLQGLAVPKLFPDIPAAMRKRYLSECNHNEWVATEYIEGGHFEHTGINKRQVIAGLIFLVEQYAAFRRRGLIYSDIKCGNVIATRGPYTVKIIDFDSTVPYKDEGPYPPMMFAFTPFFAAPEHNPNVEQYENMIVFQYGALAMHALSGFQMRRDWSGRKGKSVVKKILEETGAKDLYRPFQRCMNVDPSKRYSDLDDAFCDIADRVEHPSFSPQIKRLVRSLRRPYRGPLAELDLDLLE